MSLSPEGLEWAEYFRRIQETKSDAAEMADEHVELLEIIEPSRPAAPSDLNPATKGILGLLAVCGFWSASQVTRVLRVGTVIKSGERAGESRPDKELTNVFIHAANADRRYVKAWYVDGKLQSATIGVARKWSRVIEQVGKLEEFIEGGEDD